MATSDDSSIAQNFASFFNGWLVRLERFHERLVQALNEDDIQQQQQQLESLIQQVLSHYEQYLVEKSTAAREQVLLFYSPPWEKVAGEGRRLSAKLGTAKLRPIFPDFRIVPKGTEGAVSLEGKIVGLLASVLLASIGCLLVEI
ncbi:hypothetical protein V6N11_053397 [Hibiscus sabdariffa]|uniref:DOG1 domain-containing protein n=1 Tax=Hibiscus sabdariffa TaxID=183260 RepID=A0ABR2UDF9_9ROSI